MPIQSQSSTYEIENISRQNLSSPNNFLPWLMVACGAALVFIWPLINTMALRNILLFTGGTTGAWYLIQERHNLYQKSALPLLFIFLLFFWIGIHNFLFAHNPTPELAEIKGIWLRVLLACLLGIGTGLFARSNPRAYYLLWTGFTAFIIIFFFNYAWVSITRNNWAIPYPWEMGLYGNKISVVFYGIVSLALSCGVISYESKQTRNNNGRYIFASMICIGFTFLAFVFVGTKSGIILGLTLIFSVLISFFKNSGKSSRNIFIALILIALLGSLTYLHLKLEAKLYDGWSNLYSTINTGIQIDKYPNWQDYHSGDLPVLADGSLARESAYLRAAYATKGVQLLLENPLGYGLVEPSFMYLMRESVPNAHNFSQICSLSGWLDFALGLGIPGLVLTWAAIATAFYYSYKQKSQWSYCSRWILAGAFAVWIVAEVSRNHFVETLFFLIALLSAGNLPIIAKTRRTETSDVETAHISS